MSHVKVSLQRPAASIVLNRPEKRNALTRAMIADLAQAFGDLHLEKRVRGVVLAGTGPDFCAGLDLEEMRATSDGDPAAAQAQWHEDAQAFRDLLETMWRFPKPILAAVHGRTFASGAALALAADIAIGADDAQLGLTEPLHGLVGGMVVPLLAFRIGGGRAARLLLTGERIDAGEALRLGIFSELVPADKVWARAAELVELSARAAPQAIQLTKQMLNEQVGEQIPTLLSVGAAAAAASRTTEAATEGLAAFAQRRKPIWG